MKYLIVDMHIHGLFIDDIFLCLDGLVSRYTNLITIIIIILTTNLQVMGLLQFPK